MEQAYSILHNHLTFPYWFFLLLVFVIALAVNIVVAKRRRTQAVITSLLITYIFFILLLTLIARTPADTPKIKLIPFWSWYEVIVNHSKSLFVEILLNVMFFMPVGIFLRMLNIPLRRVAIFSLFFSLAIELTQYFTCRGLCEIWDDVFGNTCGACIGWYIGGALGKVWSSWSSQK